MPETRIQISLHKRGQVTVTLSPRVFWNNLLPSFPDVSSIHIDSFSPIAFRHSLRQRDRAIKKIKEFLSEFPDVPPTIADLCEVTQVSERTLEYAFQERYEMTPNTYLRINGVHKSLRAADPASTTVTKVATDWGFWHFGHFTSHYRTFFGEQPSDTLKKPRSGRRSF